MDKVADLFIDVDGIDDIYLKDKAIFFTYNNEFIQLHEVIPYKYVLYLPKANIKTEEIKYRDMMKNGILFYLEDVLLNLKYKELEKNFSKVKEFLLSNIKEEIILSFENLRYEDKMISKYYFRFHFEDDKGRKINLHHIEYCKSFVLYCDEITLQWRLEAENNYLYKRLTVDDIINENIEYLCYQLLQRNYEWECWGDMEC